jgi:hypothetical protein
MVNVLKLSLAKEGIASSMITDGTIDNADIGENAEIKYNKLDLSGAIVNDDISGGITYSKLDLSGSIMQRDISSNARISLNNIADVNNTPFPTYLANLASGTGTVPEASPNQSGTVNTTNQSFAGNKTFKNPLTIEGVPDANFKINIISHPSVLFSTFGTDSIINPIIEYRSGPQTGYTTPISNPLPPCGTYRKYIINVDSAQQNKSTYLIFSQILSGVTRLASFYADVTMIGNKQLTISHTTNSSVPGVTSGQPISSTCKYMISSTGEDVTATLIGKLNGLAPELAKRIRKQSYVNNEAEFIVAFGRRPILMYIVELYTLSSIDDMAVFMIKEDTPTGTLQDVLNTIAPNS